MVYYTNMHTLTPTNPSVTKHNYAFVWLIMIGDSYLPGVLVSMHSIKRSSRDTENAANLVVMVTDDVSDDARQQLAVLADYVVEVSYIEHEVRSMRTETQQALYGSWSNRAFTKMQCLGLPFQKVCFLDADQIALSTITDLFQCTTPAAPFASAYAMPCGKIRNHYVTPYNRGPDGYPRHESTIPRQVVLTCLHNGTTTLHASTMVLSPDQTDYDDYVRMIQTWDGPFGWDCNSGFDEQSLAYFYADRRRVDWTNIHHRYNFLSWKTKGFLKNEMPKIIHVISRPKVWQMEIGDWNDIIPWYTLALDTLIRYPSLQTGGCQTVWKRLMDKCEGIFANWLVRVDHGYLRALCNRYKTLESALSLV